MPIKNLTMKMLLKVGDTVQWKGAWGRDLPQLAKVTSIELVVPGEKDGGEEVQKAPWSIVETNAVVVTLDNGHWAYGDQISPASTKETALQEAAA
jgi:hypothetical protein